MSLKSGKKFSLDDITSMHEITPIDETPMVKISVEEWERLRRTVEDMEALTRAMMKERKDMYTTSRSHLTRMETLSNSQIERMNKLTKEAKEVITESKKQAGRVNANLTSQLEKWEKRQNALWRIQLLFAAVPSVLVWLLVVVSDWLH